MLAVLARRALRCFSKVINPPLRFAPSLRFSQVQFIKSRKIVISPIQNKRIYLLAFKSGFQTFLKTKIKLNPKKSFDYGEEPRRAV